MLCMKNVLKPYYILVLLACLMVQTWCGASVMQSPPTADQHLAKVAIIDLLAADSQPVHDSETDEDATQKITLYELDLHSMTTALPGASLSKQLIHTYSFFAKASPADGLYRPPRALS